jgi:hypothetical protein
VPRLLVATAVAVSALNDQAFATPASEVTAPTFSKQVAPILYGHCVSCHRAGEIASAMPLTSYEAAKPWAAAIKAQVLKRTMPPWPADSAHSVKFRNDAQLSQQDIDSLVAWVDAGAPRGGDNDLPPMPHFAQGWANRQGRAPDAVVTSPEFSVPATGEIPYVRLLVKVPLAQDRWIAAMQARPGNNALVHHMGIAEVVLADGVRAEDLQALDTLAQQMGMASGSLTTTRPAIVDPDDPGAFDMLATYTPGTTYEEFGDGNAKLLKAGNNLYINFNIHYTTTGKPEKDRSQLAFWFQPQAPEHQLYRVPEPGKTIIANGRQLLTDDPGTKAEGTDVAIPPIPPNAENYELIGITAFTKPVMIYQFQPHAHLRGKDFRYAVVYPDGREDTVLTVPNFDYHWQLTYELETPLRLPAGSKLVVTAHYDNSVNNLHLRGPFASDLARNCGPDKQAYFRNQNQSWDEMFSPIIQYAVDSHHGSQSTGSAQPQPGNTPQIVAERPRQQKPKRHELDIVAAVGCLAQNPSGAWMLTHASDPGVTKKQSTSQAELTAVGGIALGNHRYQLLGASAFNPESHGAQKVAVKGVFINDGKDSRLNITSLQTVGAHCG